MAGVSATPCGNASELCSWKAMMVAMLRATAAVTYQAGDRPSPVCAISQVAMKGAKPPKIVTARL
jgi:hypothetical protein